MNNFACVQFIVKHILKVQTTNGSDATPELTLRPFQRTWIPQINTDLLYFYVYFISGVV